MIVESSEGEEQRGSGDQSDNEGGLGRHSDGKEGDQNDGEEGDQSDSEDGDQSDGEGERDDFEQHWTAAVGNSWFEEFEGDEEMGSSEKDLGSSGED